MATPYNSTDASNTRASAATSASTSASTSGTQMSKTAQLGNVSDANDTIADQASSGLDVLKGSLSGAFDQIVKEIEPQINEYATQFAHQAIAKSGDISRQALKRVQSQSWGRIAFAGALIVGAVALLGYQAAEIASESDSLH